MRVIQITSLEAALVSSFAILQRLILPLRQWVHKYTNYKHTIYLLHNNSKNHVAFWKPSASCYEQPLATGNYKKIRKPLAVALEKERSSFPDWF